MASGFVYVLFNPDLPELVKVGKTTKSPHERAEEISAATGVPGKWHLIYHREFQDCDPAEKLVHELLDRHGPRPHRRKELFSVEPKVAIDCVLNVQDQPGTLDLFSTVQEAPRDELSLAEGLVSDGDNYLHGLNGELEDVDAAVDCYGKAAKLGAATAYERLGRIELLGLGGRKPDMRKAREFFKEADRRGNIVCHLWMSRVFLREKHTSNAGKCVIRFFERLNDAPDKNEALYAFLDFVKDEALTGRIDLTAVPGLSIYRDHLLLLLDKWTKRGGSREDCTRLRHFILTGENPSQLTADASEPPMHAYLDTLRCRLAEAKTVEAFEEEFRIRVVSRERLEYSRPYGNPATTGFRGTPRQFFLAFRLVAAKYLQAKFPFTSDVQFGQRFKDAAVTLSENGWALSVKYSAGKKNYEAVWLGEAVVLRAAG